VRERSIEVTSLSKTYKWSSEFSLSFEKFCLRHKLLQQEKALATVQGVRKLVITAQRLLSVQYSIMRHSHTQYCALREFVRDTWMRQRAAKSVMQRFHDYFSSFHYSSHCLPSRNRVQVLNRFLASFHQTEAVCYWKVLSSRCCSSLWSRSPSQKLYTFINLLSPWSRSILGFL
jgi:hypothetical protein